jgi:type I restriction enzyme S subunit
LPQIFSIKVSLPPLAEQEEIVHRVESLFSKADDLEAQYKTAMELIEALPEIILSKAFRGELVPQDPKDLPANELLKQIAEHRKITEPGIKQRKRVTGKRG